MQVGIWGSRLEGQELSRLCEYRTYPSGGSYYYYKHAYNVFLDTTSLVEVVLDSFTVKWPNTPIYYLIDSSAIAAGGNNITVRVYLNGGLQNEIVHNLANHQLSGSFNVVPGDSVQIRGLAGAGVTCRITALRWYVTATNAAERTYNWIVGYLNKLT